MQHDIMIGRKAGINKNIRGAPIEVTHARQYAARCHALQVKKLLKKDINCIGIDIDIDCIGPKILKNCAPLIFNLCIICLILPYSVHIVLC